LRCFVLCTTSLLTVLVGCATGQKSGHTEAIESHVYARPLDDVLAAATTLLTQRGWRVERSGDQLGTNWRQDASGSAFGYRVEGERIDAAHCTLHIESLAASSFAPPPQDATASGRPPGGGMSNPSGTGGDNNASGGRSTGWDGIDAPTTLGEAPPGLVILPRGRDEALEWALLQRLDPRAAQAIARADARGHLTAAPDAGAGQPQAGGAASLPLPAGCEPQVSGAETLIANRRLVLLAEVPGTNEIPDFVGRLACQAARNGVSTVLAVELLHRDQDWVETYLATRGTAADRAAFLEVTRSFDSLTPAGDGSAAVLKLIETVRVLRDAGLDIRIIAFDEAVNAVAREKARASSVEVARRIEPDALLLVVTQSASARTVLGPGETPETATLGWYLEHWGLKPVPLGLRSPGGQGWACTPAKGGCGPMAVPPLAMVPRPLESARSVELYARPDAQGFHGEYSVGTLTASPPPKG
jgi:hypothetical protein